METQQVIIIVRNNIKTKYISIGSFFLKIPQYVVLGMLLFPATKQ